jgi:bacteriorhodopsin
MSRQFTNNWQNEISLHHENTRFAFMFILFALFTCLITIMLFIFANNSFEKSQRHFIPYCILALISLTLFFIFCIGSIIYTKKSLLSSSLNSPIPLPRTILIPGQTNI